MKKTIKQYVKFSDLNKSDIIEIRRLACNNTNVKNYFYSRYSGIKSYLSLFNHRSEIRDVILSEINKYNFNLPNRYWKIALDEAISNIKSNWSNTINLVKKSVNSNEKLNEYEKHYINYILKSKQHLHNILNDVHFEIPLKISYSDIDYNKLNKLIKRLIRKYKSNIGYSYKKSNFCADSAIYKYDNSYLNIQGYIKGQRLKLKVNNDLRFDKQIRIIIQKDRLCISSQIDVKIGNISDEIGNIKTENIIGIDKNYENVISTSNGNIYGDGINKLYNEYTDLVTEKQKKRNKLYNLIKELKSKNPNDPKIQRIEKNNLGNVKNTNQREKIKQNIRSIVNNSLNEFIENEKPSEIVCEDLKFTSNSNKLNKKTKNKLNSWSKGYLRERIEYKSYQRNIKITEVNAAFTSQMCGCCGFYIGKRSDGDTFYCPNCGRGVNVHLNSASVILKRKDDSEIKLKTSPKKIVEILLTRNKRLLELKTEPTKAQDT